MLPQSMEFAWQMHRFRIEFIAREKYNNHWLISQILEDQNAVTFLVHSWFLQRHPQ
jgi:hypothetical protein